MERLKHFAREHVSKKFSKRALKRGRSYFMENYVFDVEARQERMADESHSELIAVTGTCFASYRKKKKHKVEMFMKGSPTYRIAKANCSCEAGEGERCSHVSAVVHLLLSRAAFLREEDKSCSGASPTSAKRSWGVPKRHIAPDHPISEINFKRVKEDIPYTPIAETSTQIDPRPVSLRSTQREEVECFLDNVQKAAKHPSQCLALQYITPDRVLDCQNGRFFQPQTAGSLFENLRAKPVQFPSYLETFFHTLRLKPQPPSSTDIILWTKELMASLADVDRVAIEEGTRNQSGGDD